MPNKMIDVVNEMKKEERRKKREKKEKAEEENSWIFYWKGF